MTNNSGGLIPQDFIDNLLYRTDIVDVVAERISLKKSGKNYSACCPFHKEKTPSFSVSQDKQFYYCFGCGTGGNAIGFVMAHDNLDFPQAVETLAQKAGLSVPRESKSAQPSAKPAQSPLYSVLQNACDYFCSALRQHPSKNTAVNYLQGRGLSGQIASDFALGYAPAGWDNLLKHFQADSSVEQQLLEAGLIAEHEESKRRYDRFRNRIMFPIRDSRGRVVGFGGRVLGDDKPKYLNSPETPVFHKSQELYGLYEARQSNRSLEEIIVVEGYMDVIALAQQGLRNAVATLGTATSSEHIKRLFRIVKRITFCFDGDSAGRKAAWRALESSLPQLKDGCQVRFLFLDEGDDPDDVIRREGLDAFQARLSLQAHTLSEYFFQQLIDGNEVDSLEGKARLASLASPLIEQIPGQHLRDLMQQQLKQLSGIAATNAVPAAEPQLPPPAPMFTPAPVASSQSKRKVESTYLTALRSLLHHPQLASKVESVTELAAEDDPNAQLLVSVLVELQQKPSTNPLQLISRWHGTEQGQLLRSLAEKEWLISSDNLEQQFIDTINRLSKQQHEAKINQLIRKSRSSNLSPEEQILLRELLAQKHQSTPR